MWFMATFRKATATLSKTIGSKAGRVLIGLNTGNYQAIVSQWIASNPSREGDGPHREGEEP
jgi:hypothetical protein